MKLSKIIIDGMHRTKHAEYDFNDLTYFTGVNGAGKSTILQAIQYGLLGYIPPNKFKEAIFAHSCADVMSVRMIFDNGFELFRSIRREKSKLVETVTPEDFDAESLIGNMTLPILNFSDFITMSANKMKDWYIGFLPPCDGEYKLSAQMDDVVRKSGINQILDTDFVIGYIHQASKVATTLDNVREFNARFKEDLSGYKADLARIQHTIQSLVFYDDCDTSVTIEEVQSKISEVQDEIDRIRTTINHLKFNTSCAADISRLEKDVLSEEDADRTFNQLQAMKKACELQASVRSDMDKQLTTLQIKDKDLGEIIAGNGVCPYQREVCPTIAGQIQSMISQREDIRNEIYRLRAKLREDLSEWQASGSKMYEVESVLTKHNAAKQRIEEIRSKLYKDCDGCNIEDMNLLISDLNAKLTEHNEQVAHIKANQRYEQLVSSLENDKYKTEQDIEILKLWIKLTDVNGLQSQIMNQPFDNLAATISEILSGFYGDPVTAKFNISEKANGFSFGIMRDAYVEYEHLSSGEKCIFIFAMLIAMMRQAKPELPIIMVDDFLDHLDDVMIDRLFRTLSTMDDVQIILAGVKSCDTANPYTVEV